MEACCSWRGCCMEQGNSDIMYIMYERVLDERQIASDIIDAIRSTTDAPLSSCIEAARSCMAVMAPFVQGESFVRIQEAVNSYTVQVDNCYDYRLLSEMKERLTALFKEKYELSFSTEQDDDVLVKYLGMFASCVKKTDPRVSMHLISMDDYQWMDHLINVYQILSFFNTFATMCSTGRHAWFEAWDRVPNRLSTNACLRDRPCLTRSTVPRV
ncbi:hypothetical protein Y032_0009g557 [Ancylostoma ceylanicum]|nr:hypothetical protein Y032_0009g557 [Ancylostoma ceylanicum]